MRKQTVVHYGLALALVATAPLALAYSEFLNSVKNFDPQASLSPDGRTITLSGAIGPCEAREKTSEVQAAITQETTFASANGAVTRPCSVAHPVRFVINATAAAGKPAFVAGPAEVCGTGISRVSQQILDIETWCTYVNLVNQ